MNKRKIIMTTTTKSSHRLFTLLDEEYVTPEQVIDMLVKYLSEDELAEMLDMNELSDKHVLLRFRDEADEADEADDKALRDFYYNKALRDFYKVKKQDAFKLAKEFAAAGDVKSAAAYIAAYKD